MRSDNEWDSPQIASSDPQGPLPAVRDPGEQHRADSQSQRRVDEGRNPVRERVLDNREVEAPDDDRGKQQRVGGQAMAHTRESTRRAAGRCR